MVFMGMVWCLGVLKGFLQTAFSLHGLLTFPGLGLLFLLFYVLCLMSMDDCQK